MSSSTRPILFTTARYEGLGADVRADAGLDPGVIEREAFPDGERGLRIASEVAGRDCVLLGATASDADTLELYDLGSGLAAAGAHTISFLIPYFGYGTADRATRPGEVVTAKTRAVLLSSVPRAGSGNRAFVLDAHAEGLPYYFEGDLRPFHLYAEPVILPAIRELGGDDFVLATVDAGRAKWVGHFADALGVDTAIVLKRRIDGSHTQVVATDAPVRGRRVVIYDDMIRSGGSLLAAAQAYLDAGAASVSAVATHGVFTLPSPEATVAAIEATGLIERIVVTDSHPHAALAAGGFVRLVSCAPVLAAPFTTR